MASPKRSARLSRYSPFTQWAVTAWDRAWENRQVSPTVSVPWILIWGGATLLLLVLATMAENAAIMLALVILFGQILQATMGGNRE